MTAAAKKETPYAAPKGRVRGVGHLLSLVPKIGYDIKTMQARSYTIVDVETTGGSSRTNRIIEIGAVRIQNGEVIEQFQTLLNPEISIPSFITKLTGITDKDVASAPVFEDIKDEVLELFRDSVLVAHNVSFDYGFIRDEFRRVGYGFATDTLCSVRLSRTLFPQYRHHNLDEIIKRFSFSCENRHRALDDALVVLEFMRRVQQDFPHKVVTEAYARSLKEVNRRNDSKSVLRKLRGVGTKNREVAAKF